MEKVRKKLKDHVKRVGEGKMMYEFTKFYVCTCVYVF